MRLRFFIVAILFVFLMGCGSNPVSTELSKSGANYAGHLSWGLWDLEFDSVSGNIETIPLRSADFNANVLRFLQPPIAPINLLSIAIQPGSDIPNGYWVVDVTLKHPFLGSNMWRGFDVRGIIMAEGNSQGIYDSSVRYNYQSGTRLLNPDGYTRWWNMQEFTSFGKIFGYTEGHKATPGFNATATVNPYRVFSNAIDKTSHITEMAVNERAYFSVSPGINTRTYKIQFDINGGSPPVRIKYAIDASWSLPDSSYAPAYPNDAFSLSANTQEPWLIEVGTEGFIEKPYYESPSSFGGNAVFVLNIFDWQFDNTENLDQISHIWVESPTLIDAPIDVLPTAKLIEWLQYYRSFQILVPDCTPSGIENQYFFITVESASPDSYAPQIDGNISGWEYPDAKLAAYQFIDVPIDDGGPPPPDNYWVVGLPDWCSLTEYCTSGADNLKFITNLVNWDLPGVYNDGTVFKWWEGHLTPTPPYSTSVIQSHVQSMGMTFVRTNEPVFNPENCRVIIVVFVKSPGGGNIPFSPEEINSMLTYIKHGGILCFLIENPTYFNADPFTELMNQLGVPLEFGGPVEPPSTTTVTTDITPHFLTTGMSNWQYWTAGEFTFNHPDCISLVRSPTGEHMVVLAPIKL